MAGEPMAYSQGGGKKKVCYYYDGERPGRRQGGRAGLGSQAGSRAGLRGRRSEWAPVLRGGKEEGPTSGRILTHSRPDAVRGSPSAASGPRRLCGGCQVDAPLFPLAALPPAVRSAALKAAACRTAPAYPASVEVAKGMVRPLASPARHSRERRCWGTLLRPPIPPPPGSKYLPRPRLHTKPRGPESPAPSPRPYPPPPPSPRSRLAPAPPLPSSLALAGRSVCSFLRLQLHPGPLDRVAAGE